MNNNATIRNLLDRWMPPTSLPHSTAIRLFGAPPSGVLSSGTPGTVLSPDGTQLYQVTVATDRAGILGWNMPRYSTLTVVETATNTVVGLVHVPGAVEDPPVVSPDGTRVYMTSTVWSGGAAVASYVTTIDTSSASMIGTPVRFDGWTFGGPVLSPDGSRVYQATSAVGFTQTITAIDTATGTVAGTPLVLSGGGVVGGLVMSADGSRLCLTTQTTDLANGQPQTVYVSVIDTADTSLINRMTLTGYAGAGAVVSPDNTGAAQAVTAGATTVVTYIDLSDGSVAWTATADGSSTSSAYAPIYSENGSRVSVVTAENSSAQVTVFDTSDGDVVGALALPGIAAGEITALVPDPTGKRLYVAVAAYSGSTVITVVDTSDGTIVGDPASVSGFGRLVVGADGASVYLPSSSGTFAVINSDGVVTGMVDMPSGISDVLVGPGDVGVYLLTWTAERPELVPVDAVTAATLGPAVRLRGSGVGAAPQGLLLSPDGTQIYCTQSVTLSFWTALFMTRVTVLDTAAL